MRITPRYDLAMEYFEKALRIREAALGESHPQIGDTLYNMAILYKKQSECRSAVEMLRKAAAVYTVSYGADHSKTLTALQQAEALESSMRQ